MNDRDLIRKFSDAFDKQPVFIARAPGRANLIGEHIDYNGGLVLPFAIQRDIRIAVRPRDDRKLNLLSTEFAQPYSGELPVQAGAQASWANYALGVLKQFEERGHELRGFDALLDSDVPRGAGLSSSAAFEVAVAKAAEQLLDVRLEPLELARLCQRAEVEFVGVHCGLMDQAASACAEAGHLLLLNCAIPQYEQLPFSTRHFELVIAHSGVQRGLSASQYNTRRQECAAALEIIRRQTGQKFHNLCEISLEILESLEDKLSPNLLKRSRHVITETIRVQNTVDCLKNRTIESIGGYLNESHYSLRDDYQVSCPELDDLTSLCRYFEGVLGSRLTGAGFGGCTITLVDGGSAEPLIEFLREKYYRPRRLAPLAFRTLPAAGASVEPYA